MQDFLSKQGEALDKLERVYMYLVSECQGQHKTDCQRIVIRCMSHTRASIANMIHGKVLLPSKSWGLNVEDFDPRIRNYFQGQMS